jgi:hypothetical protein
MEHKNYGFINTFDEAKERAAVDGTEYPLGSVAVDLALIPKELRLRYAPDGVLQYNNIFDTNGCASRAPLNVLEAKLNYFYENGMHPNIKAWFDAKGYRVDGRFVLCDAFIEILSGTTPTGNSLKAPMDTIYRYGVIPARYLPLKDGMTWDGYMNPSRITEEMRQLGRDFLKRIGLNYEQVPATSFLEELKKDYLDAAGHGWPEPVNGIYPRSDAPIQHAFALAEDAIDALDNYMPFTKRLAKDFKFFDWGYSLSITRQTPFPDETITLFETLQKFGLLAFFAEALKRLTQAPEQPPAPPVVPVQPPVVPPPPPTPPPTVPPAHENKLEAFCEAIKTHEGWSPGSRSWRNNNPGNCRYSSVGYLDIYKPVLKDAQNFAVFKDYATGWLYLKNLVGTKIQANPNQSIAAFFEIYAPASDNNDPVRYAQVVATACGLKTSDPISKIL